MFLDKTIILENVRRARTFFLDLLFPIECLYCGREGGWLCQKCFGKIRFNETQYCFHCKKEKERGQFCRTCQPNYFLDGVWIAGDYEDKLLMNLIKSLKFHFVKDVAKDLTKFLILFLNSLGFKMKSDGGYPLSDFKEWLIIPIPLHPRRLRWRGFNQAEEIAGGVSEYFGIEMRTDILSRVKYRAPQVKLNMAERVENIKGCFAIKEPPLLKGGRGVLTNRNIILLDDVATTGATLNEAARVLKENGAGNVWGLVVAKG